MCINMVILKDGILHIAITLRLIKVPNDGSPYKVRGKANQNINDTR